MRQRFDGYRLEEYGNWRIWVRETAWRPEWWGQISSKVDRSSAFAGGSRHARTSVVTLSSGRGVVRGFLKVYRSPGLWQAGKQQVKMSKPLRALKLGRMLAGEGFRVPVILAVGEQRRWGILLNAFLLAQAVSAIGLDQLAGGLSRMPARERRLFKRRLLALVGAEVGRMHSCGYVHGDLVVTNILFQEGVPEALWFIDHDRTSRPRSLRLARLQRRNLVQLNRIELAGVSNSDRLRVYQSYAAVRGWNKSRMRREARWLAARTRLRRLEIARLLARRRPASAGRVRQGDRRQ